MRLSDERAAALQESRLARPLLRAISKLYGAIVSLRNASYDRGWFPRFGSSLPVVSIGNVTAGGNGKTPLCIYIADRLAERGYRPVVLCRGYGGSAAGPLEVSPESSATVVGDEPLLIAVRSRARVVVARDRVAGARFVEERQLGNVILLDDGFQHRRLSRNVDIVCIDISTPRAIESFAKGEMLPAGRFREPRDESLARASIFVLSERRPHAKSREAPAAVLDRLPGQAPIFRSSFEPTSVSSRSGERLAPTRIVAFCGLGSPEGFFATLEELGFELAARRAFPDHHSFSAEDIASLREESGDLPMVCSEKDEVKLRGIEEGARLFALRVELQLFPADAFMTTLERAFVGERRQASSVKSFRRQ